VNQMEFKFINPDDASGRITISSHRNRRISAGNFDRSLRITVNLSELDFSDGTAYGG
jgi:hypothetical protein